MTETLLHGDCLELLPTIQDNSIDLILADLPFNMTNNEWDHIIPIDKLFEQYERIIKDHGAILLFGDEPFASHLRLADEKLYRYDWIWIKNNSTGFLNAKRMPLKNTERICVFYKHLPIYNPQMRAGKPYIAKNQSSSSNYGKYQAHYLTVNKGTRYPTTTIKFNNVFKTVHPTQKPVELLEYLIKTYTNEGMTVLDNTMGSGSTGVAAKKLKRNFIGMELDKEYFEIAKQRIKEA